MAETERTYKEQFNERDLFVLNLEKLEDFPAQLALSSPRFACLVAWDAREVDAAAVGLLARKLLHAGAVFMSTWGPDCERVHGIIDQEARKPAPSPDVPLPNKVIMTMGHTGQPLAEAIWDVLYGSIPDEAYAGSCGCTLAVTIGSPAWGAEVRAAFTDPIGFNSRLLHQQHG